MEKELDQHSAVAASSFASRLPAGSTWWLQTYDTQGLEEAISVQTFFGDENYLETLDIKLLAGQNFTGLAADTGKVIINQAAVKALALEDPIGAVLDAGALGGGDHDRVGRIRRQRERDILSPSRRYSSQTSPSRMRNRGRVEAT